METVATHTILLIEFIGDGIHIGLGRHGLMEGGVEHPHLGQTGHQFAHSLHTLEVGGVVEGSQVAACLKYLEHLVGEQHALVELLATMHHTVTYGVNLLQVFDDTNLRIGEQTENELHTLGVFGDIVHDLLLLAIGQFHLDESTVQAHTLGTTRGHDTLGVHIVERILDG